MRIKTTTRRVYTENRAHHQNVRKAILDMGATIMTSQTGPAFYVPVLKTKYIPRWLCLKWDDELLLPGEIARAELEKAFPTLQRIGNWRGSQIRLLNKRWPMYANGPYLGFAEYFDLVSAFWQFYGRLYLDVGYPCGFGTLDLSPVAESLSDIKTARNAVIGITRSTKVGMQKGTRHFQVSTKNKFLSPPLWANLMGWLNEIAEEALRRGAIYCMMDGFFFPENSDHEGFRRFLDAYSILYRNIRGEVHIKGWGSYMADWGRTTAPYRKNAQGRVNCVKRHFSDRYKILDFWQKSLDYRAWRFQNGKEN